MGNITLSAAWAWLLAGAAAVYTLAKAWEIVRKIMHPEADLRAEVREQKRKLDEDFRRIDRLEKGQKESHDAEAAICGALFALLNHELSGNDVDKLRRSRDELQTYLTNR